MNDNLYAAAEKLVFGLSERKLTVAAAESCTGGFISKTITDVPGASAVFLGAVVSYANSVKEKLLGVSPDTLEKYGAVSEQTAKEMAAGVKNAIGSDFAVAVTGIAGPGGGTQRKPVGLVYIAIAYPDGHTECVRNIFGGNRENIRSATVEKALAMLADAVGI